MNDHIDAKLTYPALPDHATCMIGDTEHRAVPGAREEAQAMKVTTIVPL